jgi:hypothetical protein
MRIETGQDWGCRISELSVIEINVPSCFTPGSLQGLFFLLFRKALASLTFEPGSKPSQIDAEALVGCSSLKELCILDSVKALSRRCCYGCAVKSTEIMKLRLMCVMVKFVFPGLMQVLLAMFIVRYPCGNGPQDPQV